MSLAFLGSYAKDTVIHLDDGGNVQRRWDASGGPMHFHEFLMDLLRDMGLVAADRLEFFNADLRPACFELVYQMDGSRSLSCRQEPSKLCLDLLLDLPPSHVVVSPVLNELDLEQLRMVADKHGHRIYLDIQGLLRTRLSDGSVKLESRPDLGSTLSSCSVVKFSDYELPYVVPKGVPKAQWLAETSLGGVVLTITSGPGPVFTYTEGRCVETKPPIVDVRDATGCGDIFLASLALGLSMGISQEQALRDATWIATSFAMIENRDLAESRDVLRSRLLSADPSLFGSTR